MIVRRIEELVGNEKLARVLTTWDYQIILPEGAVIRADYIDKLKELGIKEVCIYEQDEENINQILKSDIKYSLKEKVKEILEKHTYNHNRNLEELSRTADNIISTILEEDQVVERVFDIKQRSADIYEHSISICSLAILTALKMELPAEKIHDIGVACLLHDIGLRYQTCDFGNKSLEEMSEYEVSEYKKHPIYGYTILKDEDWLSSLSKDIILFHHERINGSGYPLKTKDIPLECRIVNVCDAFDEMICGIGCKRIRVHEAIEYLKFYKNKKFDTDVVDMFLNFMAVYPVGTRVLTNEGEIGIVVGQNKDFQDRPILRIVQDKNGSNIKEEKIKDLVKIQNLFIEKVLEE